MQLYPMSLCLPSLGLSDVLHTHSVTARVVVVLGIFLVGYAEAVILKSRGVASVTWFLALAAVCIWIAYPVTPARIAVGVAVFLCGVAALVNLYRKRPKDA